MPLVIYKQSLSTWFSIFIQFTWADTLQWFIKRQKAVKNRIVLTLQSCPLPHGCDHSPSGPYLSKRESYPRPSFPAQILSSLHWADDLDLWGQVYSNAGLDLLCKTILKNLKTHALCCLLPTFFLFKNTSSDFIVRPNRILDLLFSLFKLFFSANVRVI